MCDDNHHGRLTWPFLSDLKFAARGLRRAPGFTLPAIAALALSLGANGVVFSLINGVLLRPLPFPNSDRIVNIWEANMKRNIPREVVSSANYSDWRAKSTVFAQMGLWQPANFNITSPHNEPERVIGTFCDPGLFRVLGTTPVWGRTFTDLENEPGRDDVAVVSYSLAVHRFGGSFEATGKQLHINGRTRSIIGVMPPQFDYPAKTNIWLPIALDAKQRSRRDLHRFHVIAQLKSGINLSRCRSELSAVSARLARQYPDLDRDQGVTVNPMLEDTVAQVRPALLMLACAVVLVLLIACANVANLSLARAAARTGEIALRSSLGAGRGALLRLTLTESCLLAFIGGVVSLLWANAAFRGLLAVAPPQLPRLSQLEMDWRVLAFTLVLSLVTGILFGLSPAWLFVRRDLNTFLRANTRQSSPRGLVRSFLVVVQTAFAFTLLVGSALLLHSLYKLLHIDPGFQPTRLITMRISPEPSRYLGKNDLQIQLGRSLLETVGTVPGIKSAAITTDIPLLDDSVYIMRFFEHPNVAPSEAALAHTAAVSPDYFRSMGIRTEQGRTFTDVDTATTRPVAVISRTLADLYFPGQNPLGKRLEVVFRTPPEWREIVGVVNDVRSVGLDRDSPPQVYTPFFQRPAMISSILPAITVLARTGGGLIPAGDSIKQAIVRTDPTLPVFAVQPMSEVLSQSVAQQRLSSWLLAFFAMSALLLAALGIYSVVSSMVVHRTREMGIRLAIGAQPRDVLMLIQRDGMRLVLIGLGLGVLGALSLARGMRSLLFQTQPADPAILCFTGALLAVVGLFACTVPASRAMRVDPIHALHHE